MHMSASLGGVFTFTNMIYNAKKADGQSAFLRCMPFQVYDKACTVMRKEDFFEHYNLARIDSVDHS